MSFLRLVYFDQPKEETNSIYNQIGTDFMFP